MAFNWDRARYPEVKDVHPIADMFPMLDETDMNALAADIKANGLQTPIYLSSEGTLIDGRNRLTGCDLAGVTPKFETVETDPLTFIISANTMRRQMTKSQLSVVTALMEIGTSPADEAATLGTVVTGTQRLTIAKKLHGLVTESVIKEAIRIVRFGPHDLAPQVLSGELEFTSALDEARRRQQNTQSAAEKMETLRKEAPTIADQVNSETLSIDEGWAAYRQRLQDDREARDRTTRQLDSLVRPLVDLSTATAEQVKESVGRYDATKSLQALTKADFDAAIKVLQGMKRVWVDA